VDRAVRTAGVACKAQDEKVQIAAGAGGLLASALCLVSEYTLKTTGSGLPPGPGGLIGAAEGISYLVRSCELLLPIQLALVASDALNRIFVNIFPGYS
jgi:hypothetical protein